MQKRFGRNKQELKASVRQETWAGIIKVQKMRTGQQFCRKGAHEERKVKSGPEVQQVSGPYWGNKRHREVGHHVTGSFYSKVVETGSWRGFLWGEQCPG